MSITKEDWGVQRVEKELAALTKRLYRRPGKRKRRGQETRTGKLYAAVGAKRRQLKQARINWQKWCQDPEWQVAISEMVCGISQAGLRFEP